MLTLDDCIAFGELSQELVRAIAEHEGVPELSAVAIGSELANRVDGIRQIRSIGEQSLRAALARGDHGFADALEASLASFVAEHTGVFA